MENESQEMFVVVPFSRPKFAKNIIDNFERQKYKNKKLIVVENGPATGTFNNLNYKPYVVIQSSQSPGAARNEGLRFIKRHFANTMWANFDDDDYYGPNYLSEIIKNKNKGFAFIKVNIFMKNTSGNLLLLDKGIENTYLEPEKSNFIFGFTMASWTKGVPLFSTGIRVGEDNIWIQQILNENKKIYVTSRYNAAAQRFINDNNHNGHSWKTTDIMIIKHSKNVYDYGKFDENIINRIKRGSQKKIDLNNYEDYSPEEKKYYSERTFQEAKKYGALSKEEFDSLKKNPAKYREHVLKIMRGGRW